MTLHDKILLRMHRERMAGHIFSMLMLRLGVRMTDAPIEDLVRGGA